MDIENYYKQQNSSKGITTLINLGNSCFMNVCVQILGHTLPLRAWMTSGKFKESLTSNELKHEFVRQFYRLMDGMYEEDCIVQPITFRNTLTQCVLNFDGFRQQDAHECMVFILQLLHEALASPAKFDDFNPKDPDLQRDPMKSWQSFLSHEKYSLIIDWFYGQLKTMKRCENCKTVYPTFESFNSISLEFPATTDMKGEYTLEDLFDSSITPELLGDGYQCERCDSSQTALSQQLLWSCPAVLCIQIKRFRMNGAKIKTPVNFPLTLDVAKYVSPENRGRQYTVYDLYGVVYHEGELNGGHYYNACRLNWTDTGDAENWYLFNDDQTKPIPEDRLQRPSAYLLYYKKRYSPGEAVPDLWWS